MNSFMLTHTLILTKKNTFDLTQENWPDKEFTGIDNRIIGKKCTCANSLIINSTKSVEQNVSVI